MIKVQYKHGMEYRLRETLKAFKVDKIYSTTEDRMLAIESLPKDVSIDEMSKWTTVEKVKADGPKQTLNMALLAKLMNEYNAAKGNKDSRRFPVFASNGGNLSKGRLKKRDDGSISIPTNEYFEYTCGAVVEYVDSHGKDSMIFVNDKGEPLKDLKIDDAGNIVFTF